MDFKKLSDRVMTDIAQDESDRKAWLSRTQQAIKIAEQAVEEKTFPYTGASNVKLPLVLDACVKFASRAYAEIIAKDGVVKIKNYGEDRNRADRVKKYMNYQLLCIEKEWETMTDQLLHVLPVVGHVFRKRFYNVCKQRTDSEMLMPDAVICSKDGRRKTHKICGVTYSDIVAKQRAGQWRKIELLGKDAKLEDLEKTTYTVYESHCWLDLDEDGYEEPYIVVIEDSTRDVLMVKKRFNAEDVSKNEEGEIYHIEPIEYFIDYRFIPDPAGGYYGIGFGQMMGPLTLSANSLINQLIDAGTLSNSNAGFLGDNVDILSGSQQFRLGEWKKIKVGGNKDLQSSIYPLPVREPSPTLFNLLGLLIELNKDLSSIKDVLTGDSIGSNVAATTTVALVEQGMKTFNTIYKRIYHSLMTEFKLLYKLNSQYMNMQEQYNYRDQVNFVFADDFNDTNLEIIPVANPELASNVQRLMKAEAMKNTIGMPGVNPIPIMRYYYEALGLDEGLIEEIMAQPEQQGPSPEQMAMMQELEMKQADLQVEEEKVRIKSREVAIKERDQDLEESRAEAERVETITSAIRNLANAEALEKGAQVEEYRAKVEGIQNGQRMAQTSGNSTNSTGSTSRARPTIGDDGIN